MRVMQHCLPLLYPALTPWPPFSQQKPTGASVGREPNTIDECWDLSPFFFCHAVDSACSHRYISVLVLGLSLNAAGDLQSTNLNCRLPSWRGNFGERRHPNKKSPRDSTGWCFLIFSNQRTTPSPGRAHAWTSLPTADKSFHIQTKNY